MRCRILPILLTFLLFATCAHAQMASNQATFEPNEVWSPALASSPDGLSMLAYATSGDPLLVDFIRIVVFPTMASDNLIWDDAVTLTSGHAVEICWSRTGFYAAVNGGEVVLLYHADHSGNWDLVQEVILNANGYVTGMDLWGVLTDAAGPDVFLTVETWTNPPYGERQVRFASHNSYGWSDLETVVTESDIRPNPQITWSIGPAGPFPTIFYVHESNGEFQLNYITKDLASGWLPPSTVPAPCPIAGDFDVVTKSFLQRHVLGLGLQPPCPCGSIHHQEYDPGEGWLPSENLTQYYADYDWPKSPKIAAGSDGRIHAFWFQEAADHELVPWRRTLEYQVLENGVWTDEGDFLDDPGYGAPYGPRLAIVANPAETPVLAWTRLDTIDGNPQPQQIWVGRVFDLSDVPDITQAQLELSAWPNPFNPLVKVAFETAAVGQAWVDVFDARGRLITRLLDQVVAAGRTVVDWNGTDDAGRTVPSGIYFARVVSGGERGVVKLVLAE